MCALPCTGAKLDLAPGPDPPQPLNLLRRGPWRARRTCCSAPTWVPSSPSARCLGLTPRLRDPQFGSRIRSETICFKNPMKRTPASSLSPKRSVARTQQPRSCGPQYTRRGPRERQVLGRQVPFSAPSTRRYLPVTLLSSRALSLLAARNCPLLRIATHSPAFRCSEHPLCVSLFLSTEPQLPFHRSLSSLVLLVWGGMG